MEAFRLPGSEISICDAIETKRYLFHIRHGPLRCIQWCGDVALPARTRLSIVDKSPCLTPVQISRTKREIDFHSRETETKFRAMSYGRFRHFKCSHEKLSVQSGGIFAMEFGSLDFESTSGRASVTRDRHLKMSMKYLTASVNVYDSVFLLPSMPSTCGYLQFSKKNAARSITREINNNFMRKYCIHTH